MTPKRREVINLSWFFICLCFSKSLLIKNFNLDNKNYLMPCVLAAKANKMEWEFCVNGKDISVSNELNGNSGVPQKLSVKSGKFSKYKHAFDLHFNWCPTDRSFCLRKRQIN